MKLKVMKSWIITQNRKILKLEIAFFAKNHKIIIFDVNL